MEPFPVLRGAAATLLLPDINTDVIAPAHGGRGSMSANAFAPLRYLADGRGNPDFVLNQPRFADAPILLTGHNFGCGSSRESAVWSLLSLGIRCVIAESFGDIFYGNCFQNGVLPIVLGRDAIAQLARDALLTAPILPTLLRLALPTVTVLVAQTAVNIAEAYYVGFLGTDALAGAALVFPIFMLMA